MSRASTRGTPILLASGSPRRRDFLASVQIPFEVVRPEVDETPRPGEPPDETVRRLAEAKAEAGHELCPRGAGLVLAADTEVVLDRLNDAAEDVGQHGRQHRVFGLEVQVEGAPGHARAADDVVHRGVVVARVGEGGGGGIEDAGAGLCTAPGRQRGAPVHLAAVLGLAVHGRRD